MKEKGCVYFFRHIGLTPIKIWFSTNESPISRFENFKVYAPYGAELIGFIRTFEAKELETTLHNKFSQYRINGEWFEVPENEIEKCITFYSNIEDVKEKNDFQIQYSKFIDESRIINNNAFFEMYSKNKNEIFKNEVILKKNELSLFMNKDEVNLFLIKNDLEYKTHRFKGIIKKGIKVYKL